jgi:hypothetical protein
LEKTEHKDFYDRKGNSLLIINSPKGEKYWELTKSSSHLFRENAGSNSSCPKK